jgi:hypothetical protein
MGLLHVQTAGQLCSPFAGRVRESQLALPAGSAANLCHVFWALAVILLAFAGFTLIVVKLRRPARTRDDSGEALDRANSGRRIDLEQLKGFVYVGAAALVLLAVAVILMGLFANRNGRAEGLAVLGFFGYAAYLVAATAVLYVMSRKG